MECLNSITYSIKCIGENKSMFYLISGDSVSVFPKKQIPNILEIQNDIDDHMNTVWREATINEFNSNRSAENVILTC